MVIAWSSEKHRRYTIIIIILVNLSLPASMRTLFFSVCKTSPSFSCFSLHLPTTATTSIIGVSLSFFLFAFCRSCCLSSRWFTSLMFHRKWFKCIILSVHVIKIQHDFLIVEPFCGHNRHSFFRSSVLLKELYVNYRAKKIVIPRNALSHFAIVTLRQFLAPNISRL